MTLLVMHPGALSTVQDLGRPGHGRAGVAPSGAMDPWALRAANVLVSNEEGAAAIEFTMRGPTIAFEDDTIVALTGSRFEVSILRSVSGSAFERDVDVTSSVPCTGVVAGRRPRVVRKSVNPSAAAIAGTSNTNSQTWKRIIDQSPC